jgi:hypothetical protein
LTARERQPADAADTAEIRQNGAIVDAVDAVDAPARADSRPTLAPTRGGYASMHPCATCGKATPATRRQCYTCDATINPPLAPEDRCRDCVRYSAGRVRCPGCQARWLADAGQAART